MYFAVYGLKDMGSRQRCLFCRILKKVCLRGTYETEGDWGPFIACNIKHVEVDASASRLWP